MKDLDVDTLESSAQKRHEIPIEKPKNSEFLIEGIKVYGELRSVRNKENHALIVHSEGATREQRENKGGTYFAEVESGNAGEVVRKIRGGVKVTKFYPEERERRTIGEVKVCLRCDKIFTDRDNCKCGKELVRANVSR